VHFLMGDSSESGLEFNYLAFLKDVIDCAVVLLDNEGVIAASSERKRGCERDAATVIAALGELGRRTLDVSEPVAREHKDNAIGRCATAIATATREAIEREATQIRTSLAADLAEIDKLDQRQRARNTEVLDKLLRGHELPLAEKTWEVVFSASAVKAAFRQRTSFGVEAILGLEIPPASVLQPDLRVDKLVEHAELSALEVGGWLRKSDKLVPHKIGRYVIGKIVVGADVTIRLRATPEADGPGFDLVKSRTGEILIESVSGEPARELTIDDTNRPALKLLAEKLEAAVRLLGDRRTGVASVQIDNVALAEHPHPRVLAERLILAVAPMVHKIAKHSRSPGELVLRRMLGEDRREEIFVTTAELVKRWSALPAPAREVFAPLGLEADPAAPVPDLSGPHRRTQPVTGAIQRPRSITGSLPPLPPGTRPPSNAEASATVVVAPSLIAPTPAVAAPAAASIDDESIPELTDVVADDSAPHRAVPLLDPPSVIIDSSLEDPPMVEDAPVGRLAKLTRLDQARLSAAIDAALEDEDTKN